MEETHNQKIWRITMWTLAVIVVALTFLKMPKDSQLNETKAQIKQTNVAIKQAKVDSENNSPINKSADLDKAQKSAQSKLTKGLKESLGGYKNTSEFEKNQNKLNELFGKGLTNQLYRMNLSGEDQLPSSNKKNPKFILDDKTKVVIGFTDISDMHSASLDALVEMHQKGPDKKLYKQVRLINFNYDLKNGQVNNSGVKKLQALSNDGTISEN